MNTSIPHFIMIKPRLKQTVLMEANNALLTFLQMVNTKLNLAKTFLCWVFAIMEISVNLLMEIMSLILSFVEVFTRQKNAKIFGKKVSVYTEFVANFSTQNVLKGQVIKIIQNI